MKLLRQSRQFPEHAAAPPSASAFKEVSPRETRRNCFLREAKSRSRATLYLTGKSTF
jgi:hypothetical protein